MRLHPKNSMLLFLLLTPLVGQTNNGNPNRIQEHEHSATNVPKTVDEAVSVLKKQWLSAKDLDWLLRTPRNQAVAILYRPFGTGVRNQFHLWSNNQQLETCGADDPEGCSVVIFNRLWESVRAEADPSLVRQLDCQFRLVEAIQIDYKGFDKITTRELLKRLQSQVDAQMTMLEGTATAPCQNSLSLELEGEPDKNCFVDASFARHGKGKPKGQPTEANLEMVLGWLGVRNSFMARHVPPQLVLNYSRHCQFPKPAPSY